jgi:TatD DNase family protein
MWVDSHNHLQDPRLGNVTPLVSAMREAGIHHGIVNATCQSDWSAVEALAAAEPDLISPGFGIHPWRAHTAGDGWLAHLRALLLKFPRASIGECGLDHWISEPTLAVQRPVFLDQLRLARELDRPLTIHCLRAWGALFDAFDEAPPPPRFLMHSFNGSIETARRLLPLGAFF